MIDFSNLIRKGAEHEQERYRIAPLGRALQVVREGRALLYDVRKAMPSVIIVGGYVRDTYFMRDVKDVDFMTANEQDVELMQTWLNKPLLNCLRRVPTATRGGYASTGCMVAAYETEEKDVNLLHVSSVMGRIEEFPDSISQCWTNGSDMYGTPAFMATVMSRVVTLDHGISPEREARLKAKYPDFNFEYDCT